MIKQRLVLTALIGLVSGNPDDPFFDDAVSSVEKIRFEAIEPLVAKTTENLIVDIYVSSIFLIVYNSEAIITSAENFVSRFRTSWMHTL